MASEDRDQLPAKSGPGIGVGDQAPDLTVEDATGQRTQLADLWRERPVALVFIRHYGCLFCREQLAQLRQRYADFQAAGAEVVIMGMGTPAQTRTFIADQQLPFPVLADPRRRTHQAYGAQRGNLRRVLFNPHVLARGAATIANGHNQGRTVGDIMQLSASFIIDSQGVIRFARRAEYSSDYATADELLAALAAPGVPAAAKSGEAAPPAGDPI